MEYIMSAQRWVLVPVEITDEMWEAAIGPDHPNGQELWDAVLAAAPRPVATEEDVELVAIAVWTVRYPRDSWFEPVNRALRAEYLADARAALRAMGFEVPA
jgi:hypothetical protein